MCGEGNKSKVNKQGDAKFTRHCAANECSKGSNKTEPDGVKGSKCVAERSFISTNKQLPIDEKPQFVRAYRRPVNTQSNIRSYDKCDECAHPYKSSGEERRLSSINVSFFYHPLSTHSWRCGRSVPMVVFAPWPGNTMVSSGNTKSFCSTD